MNSHIDLPLLRVYSWNKKTYSLGKNQLKSKELRDTFCIDYPVVKRMTGGQSILHDTKENELTYSLVIYCESNFKKLYYDVAKVFINFLRTYNLNANMGYENPQYINDFFCFSTKTKADIVIGDVKVIGSAQYRKNKYVLQHGSVKLDLISKLAGKHISYELALSILKNIFESNYNVRFIDYTLAKSEYEKINALNSEFII